MKIKKSKQIFQPKKPVDLKAAMNAQAREVRKQSDRAKGIRSMNYEEFCAAIDKEINDDEIVGTGRFGEIPARDFYKITAKAMVDINPKYNLYEAFLDILFN